MRQAKRWRYYCDFCKKSGGSKHHMAKHEKSCTANPNRVCKMHKFIAWDRAEDGLDTSSLSAAEIVASPSVVVASQEYRARAMNNCGRDSKQLVGAIRIAADGCPSCMLAAVRLINADQEGDGDLDPYGPYIDSASFSYAKERDAFWGKFPADERCLIADRV